MLFHFGLFSHFSGLALRQFFSGKLLFLFFPFLLFSLSGLQLGLTFFLKLLCLENFSFFLLLKQLALFLSFQGDVHIWHWRRFLNFRRCGCG